MSSFLRDAWYVAAWAEEVSQQLAVRTILDEPILLFRKIDGTPVAFANRCPHRFAPLSMGKRVGDNVQCGYHGLQFNELGVCVYNPVGDGRIPKRAAIRRYPIIERHGLLWIWMGDPEAPDEALLPNFDAVLSDPRYTRKLLAKDNYIHVKANYLLIIDNLLDPSHIPILHEKTLSARYPSIARVETAVQRHKRRVDVSLQIPNMLAIDTNRLVDHWTDTSWHAPSLVVFSTGDVPAGEDRSGVLNGIAAHFVTPETDRSSHYFYFVLVANQLGPGLSDEEASGMVRHIFATEDAPMFEACQTMMGTSDLLSLKPVFLSQDKAGATARKLLESLIAMEASGGRDSDLTHRTTADELG
jgi:phenylpropionate dioxygenase-like ring-hydroxylating dioxygenase large terminal subunit